MTSNQQLAATLRILASGYSTELGRDAILSAAQIVERTPDETKPPHCMHCHCEEAAKGMVDRGDFNRFRNAVLKIAHDKRSHAYETCDDGQSDYWRVVNIARSAASGTDPGSQEEPTCSTCGRTKDDPAAMICSNSFHLSHIDINCHICGKPWRGKHTDQERADCSAAL